MQIGQQELCSVLQACQGFTQRATSVSRLCTVCYKCVEASHSVLQACQNFAQCAASVLRLYTACYKHVKVLHSVLQVRRGFTQCATSVSKLCTVCYKGVEALHSVLQVCQDFAQCVTSVSRLYTACFHVIRFPNIMQTSTRKHWLTGLGLSTVWQFPWPSLPYTPLPQVYRVPEAPIAALCPLPHATSTITFSGNVWRQNN